MTKQVTYSGIVFLHQEETYEVRKNQTGTIKYYTRTDTGESGMSVRGLANACGVGHQSLDEFLDTTTIFMEVSGKTSKKADNTLNININKVAGKPNIYLIESDDVHVICDIFCERVIYYYAFESRYKKTKARELYQSLAQHGLRQFIHSKTGYQATLAAQHDNSLELSIDEQLKRENEALKLELVKKEELLVEQAEKIRQLEYKPVYEKTHQAHLYAQWGGIREFHVGSPYPGRIDLVTEQMVVEVKRVANFEVGFGQLLRYRAQLQGTEHEYKTYVLYLFGDVTEDEQRILQVMAKQADFQLMIECNLKDFMDANELSARDKITIVFSQDDVAA